MILVIIRLHQNVASKNFYRIEAKDVSFLVDNNSEHKIGKYVNRNAVAALSHSEYKNVLLNNKVFETFNE